MHRKVYNRLIESDDDTENSLGEKLDNLRKNRNFADYDNKFYIKNVGLSEEIYNEIIELLDNLNKKSK